MTVEIAPTMPLIFKIMEFVKLAFVGMEMLVAHLENVHNLRILHIVIRVATIRIMTQSDIQLSVRMNM